jgi:hypothetical protein
VPGCSILLRSSHSKSFEIPKGVPEYRTGFFGLRESEWVEVHRRLGGHGTWDFFCQHFRSVLTRNLQSPLCYSYTMPYLTRQSDMSLPIVPVAGFKLLDTASLRVCVVPTFVPDAPTVFIKNYPAFLRAARVRWSPPSACVRRMHVLMFRPSTQ